MNSTDVSDASEGTATRWRVVLWTLFAIAIPVWVITCLLQEQFQLGRSFFGYVCFSLLIFLCAMLGFWSGLGNAWWRWIVIAIASPMMGFIAANGAGAEHLQFQVFCFSIIAIVGLTTFVLRIWKGSLQPMASQADAVDALQFGIKDILIWTTAIAIFLGAGQLVIGQFEEFGQVTQFSAYVLILGLAFSISIAIVFNIWAMLGNRISVSKTIILILVTAGAAVANSFLIPTGYFFGGVTLIAQLFILLTMFILRNQGLRFVKTQSR